MRSLRIMFGIIFLSAMLFLAVPLRCMAASQVDCNDVAKAYYTLAIKRDSGMSLIDILHHYIAAWQQDLLSGDQFAQLTQAILYVYHFNDKTPAELMDNVKRECMAQEKKLES